MKLTEKQAHMLLHATGNGADYRRHYCASLEDAETVAAGDALVALGLMERRRTTDLYPYANFAATDAGVAEAKRLYRERQAAHGLREYMVTHADHPDHPFPVWAKSAGAAKARCAREVDAPFLEVVSEYRVRLAP